MKKVKLLKNLFIKSSLKILQKIKVITLKTHVKLALLINPIITKPNASAAKILASKWYDVLNGDRKALLKRRCIYPEYLLMRAYESILCDISKESILNAHLRKRIFLHNDKVLIRKLEALTMLYVLDYNTAVDIIKNDSKLSNLIKSTFNIEHKADVLELYSKLNNMLQVLTRDLNLKVYRLIEEQKKNDIKSKVNFLKDWAKTQQDYGIPIDAEKITLAQFEQIRTIINDRVKAQNEAHGKRTRSI